MPAVREDVGREARRMTGGHFSPSRVAARLLEVEAAPARTFVYGETRKASLEWLRRNDIPPYARETIVIAGPVRGFAIRPEDRVVFVGDVKARRDYVRVLIDLMPSLASVGIEKIERVP